MSKTLKEQLEVVCINDYGEVCANLETNTASRSKKVSDKQREDVVKNRKRFQELRIKEREMEQRINILRSDGLKSGPGTEQCIYLFAEANEINNMLRGIRKEIRKLNKRIYK